MRRFVFLLLILISICGYSQSTYNIYQNRNGIPNIYPSHRIEIYGGETINIYRCNEIGVRDIYPIQTIIPTTPNVQTVIPSSITSPIPPQTNKPVSLNKPIFKGIEPWIP